MLRLLVLATLVLSGHCFEENNEPDFEESEHVVGGTEAKRNSWPSQISLQFNSGGSWRHNCGGTLIRTNWVMTAAHCVDNNWTYRVVVGDHNYQQHEGTEQYINVAKIIRHANWNLNNIVAGWDIALVKLASHAVLNNYVQLGRLPPEGQILSHNHPCIITGWGNTRSGGQLAATLQQAPLPVVDYKTCSSSNYWGGSAKSSMVCAGGNGSQSGCQGDSGGPLHCAVSGTYYVHGVTSFVSTSGCNVVRKPTMFTRVSAYISWMENVMRNY